jgi:hypothetical protein
MTALGARGASQAARVPPLDPHVEQRASRILSWAPKVRAGRPLLLPRAAHPAPRASSPRDGAARGVACADAPLRGGRETPRESSLRAHSASVALPGASRESTSASQVSTRASRASTRASQASTSASRDVPCDLPTRALRRSAPSHRRSALSSSRRRCAPRAAAETTQRLLLELVLCPFESSRSASSLHLPPCKDRRPIQTSRLPTRAKSLPVSEPQPPSPRAERPSVRSMSRPPFPRPPEANPAPRHALRAPPSPFLAPPSPFVAPPSPFLAAHGGSGDALAAHRATLSQEQARPDEPSEKLPWPSPLPRDVNGLLGTRAPRSSPVCDGP